MGMMGSVWRSPTRRKVGTEPRNLSHIHRLKNMKNGSSRIPPYTSWLKRQWISSRFHLSFSAFFCEGAPLAQLWGQRHHHGLVSLWRRGASVDCPREARDHKGRMGLPGSNRALHQHSHTGRWMWTFHLRGKIQFVGALTFLRGLNIC